MRIHFKTDAVVNTRIHRPAPGALKSNRRGVASQSQVFWAQHVPSGQHQWIAIPFMAVIFLQYVLNVTFLLGRWILEIDSIPGVESGKEEKNQFVSGC
ncbi:hypothetical protein [Delftia acidovorans]|uniref:hypothetical protein n=1 Tax=Delftia acidovorans TaxID=80866 RepID=UPI0012FE7B92|nr:hypothetical protein [Delftia acidovorans]